jgi:predicted enzyme related to lactoylglutathione lyase
MGVLGIGGIFFRATDPESLAAWYAEHLGVGLGLGPDGSTTDTPWAWQVEGGPVVFQPFTRSDDYWPVDRPVMLNLRVTDIDALLESLRGAGIAVETRPEWDATPEIGRFARIYDPEGNPIELWEPAS